jgi:hypothetical protein
MSVLDGMADAYNRWQEAIGRPGRIKVSSQVLLDQSGKKIDPDALQGLLDALGERYESWMEPEYRENGIFTTY